MYYAFDKNGNRIPGAHEEWEAANDIADGGFVEEIKPQFRHEERSTYALLADQGVAEIELNEFTEVSIFAKMGADSNGNFSCLTIPEAERFYVAFGEKLAEAKKLQEKLDRDNRESEEYWKSRTNQL